MASPYWVTTEDWHTAGEPFRIVENLPAGHLPDGSTVAERRFSVIETAGHPLDILRQSLCHEPRGHADMYGGFIMPPNDDGAHFGVLFWHKDGFSTACGHGTIALGYWAVSRGIVKGPEGDGAVDVTIDVPSGRVKATLNFRQGKPVSCDFINVLSFQLAKDLSVRIPSLDTSVKVSLSFGGAIYATLDAAQIGLVVEPKHVDEFIKLGREVKHELIGIAKYKRYDLYGVIFFSDEEDSSQAEPGVVRQRNVTVFADGQIDRSPCGSGTCARLAVLLAEGRLEAGRSKLSHQSIIGTSFEGAIISEEASPVESFRACIPRVRGSANLVGKMNFYIDPDETVFPGFLLR